jgi:hypothetical protein
MIPVSLRFLLATLSVVLLAIFAMPRTDAAMVIRHYDSNVHDRFDTDRQGADFLAEAFDLSGVGRTSGRWGTLVTPTAFVSANHSHPGIGDLLRFYHTNDPNGPYEERKVIAGQRITSGTAKTDIWLGELESPVSSSVAVYEIADSLSIGQYVVNVGRDESGSYTSQRVGDNFVTGAGVSSFKSVFTDSWIVEFDYDDPENGGNPDETLLRSGDSGGPTFTVNNGALELLGIHSLTADADPPGISDGDFSVDSLVSPYQTEIYSISPVPEPSALLLLLLGGLMFYLRGAARRR